MANCLTKPVFHIVVLLALAIAISACGRRGGLEAPGIVQTQDSDANILLPTNSDPVEPEQPVEPKADKPFFLDGLL